jgi:hypothetical protein
MKKLFSFIKDTWNCYTSPNTLTYNEPDVIKLSDLSAIFIEYFCYGYMFTLFFVFIFTIITTMIVSGFSLQLFIFLMALIGFTITVFVSIKNKCLAYYDKCKIYTKKVVNNIKEAIKAEEEIKQPIEQSVEQQTTTVTA